MESMNKIDSVKENAYYAGFFDGEGSVSICRHYENKKTLVTIVSISQVDPRPLHRLKEKYGGSLMLLKNKPAKAGGTSKPIWRWQVSNRQIEPFLQDIYPYLVVKKDEVELALSIRKTMRVKKEQGFWRKTPEDVAVERERVYKKYIDLRVVGGAK